MNNMFVMPERKGKPFFPGGRFTKVRIFVFFVFYLFIPCVSSSFAFPRMEMGFSFHGSFESGSWEKSFPAGVMSDGTGVKGVSRLEYERLGVMSFSLDASLRVFSGVYLDLGFSPDWFNLASRGGSGVDSDYLTAAGYRPLLFSRSSFDNKDRSFHFNAAAKIILLKDLIGDGNAAFYALAGYMKNTHKITMTQGVQTISDNSAFSDPLAPPVGSRFPGLNSTYRFDWDTVKIGFGVSGRIFPWLEAGCSPSFLYSFYSGEGYWNLRTQSASPGTGAWRNESPNFIHRNASGIGFGVELKAGFRLSRCSRLIAAYGLICQNASEGSDTIHFYDSSYGDQYGASSLDLVEFIRHDLSLGVALSI